jgi:hypothetical protein
LAVIALVAVLVWAKFGQAVEFSETVVKQDRITIRGLNTDEIIKARIATGTARYSGTPRAALPSALLDDLTVNVVSPR